MKKTVETESDLVVSRYSDDAFGPLLKQDQA